MIGLRLGYDHRSVEESELSSHEVKSSAFSVGIMELGTLCKAFEVESKEENWGLIDEEVAKLDALIRQVESIFPSFSCC